MPSNRINAKNTPPVNATDAGVIRAPVNHPYLLTIPLHIMISDIVAMPVKVEKFPMNALYEFGSQDNTI